MFSEIQQQHRAGVTIVENCLRSFRNEQYGCRKAVK